MAQLNHQTTFHLVVVKATTRFCEDLAPLEHITVVLSVAFRVILSMFDRFSKGKNCRYNVGLFNVCNGTPFSFEANLKRKKPSITHLYTFTILV